MEVVDNLSRGRRDWLHSEAELHEVDLRDGAALRRAVARVAPKIVVHLAAMHFIPAVEGAPELAWEINVNGTSTCSTRCRSAAGATALRVNRGRLSGSRVTDVRDVADALDRLLHSGRDDTVIFNVDSGRSVSVAELVHACEPSF